MLLCQNQCVYGEGDGGGQAWSTSAGRITYIPLSSPAPSASVSSLFEATPGRVGKGTGRCGCKSRPAGQRTEQKAQV